MARLNHILLKSKFKGTLLGSLIGDCFGTPFKGDTVTYGDRLIIRNYLEKLAGPYFEAPKKKYTDGTLFTKCIAESLIEKSELDVNHIAQLFVKETYSNPLRDYSDNSVDIFRRLNENCCSDIYGPAKQQHDGFGSFGNGGARRVAPLVLFYYEDKEVMLDAVKDVTRITHSNNSAINGALLLSLAIRQTLLMNPNNDFDIEEFIAILKYDFKKVEIEANTTVKTIEFSFCGKLDSMMTLLKTKFSNDHDFLDKVSDVLGNGLTAMETIPTALFCFLKALPEKSNKMEFNPFRKCIQHALSLGGDTDVIAGLAASLSGAYFGEEIIESSLKEHCESYKEMKELGEKLFSVLHRKDLKRADVE